MVYKVLIQNDLKVFEEMATELLRLGYAPVGSVAVNMVIVGENQLTQQRQMAQMFIQGFIGDQELLDKGVERNSSPLITA